MLFEFLPRKIIGTEELQKDWNGAGNSTSLEVEEEEEGNDNGR